MAFSSQIAAVAAGHSPHDFDPSERVRVDYETQRKIQNPPIYATVSQRTDHPRVSNQARIGTLDAKELVGKIII